MTHGCVLFSSLCTQRERKGKKRKPPRKSAAAAALELPDTEEDDDDRDAEPTATVIAPASRHKRQRMQPPATTTPSSSSDSSLAPATSAAAVVTPHLVVSAAPHVHPCCPAPALLPHQLLQFPAAAHIPANPVAAAVRFEQTVDDLKATLLQNQLNQSRRREEELEGRLMLAKIEQLRALQQPPNA